MNRKLLKSFPIVPVLAVALALLWINTAAGSSDRLAFYLLCGQPYVAFLVGWFVCWLWTKRKGGGLKTSAEQSTPAEIRESTIQAPYARGSISTEIVKG